MKGAFRARDADADQCDRLQHIALELGGEKGDMNVMLIDFVLGDFISTVRD